MEDFIFDDDVDEVGAEVEAHCPKCKADTTHVIISKYEDEIRRVQCNPCGDVHAFRKPKGDVADDDTPEPAPKKKAQKAKPTWEQVMAKSKKPPRQYALGEFFKEMEIVSHPKFGVGYVTENIGDDKIEVTFQDDKRVLVHNRKGLNLPFSMIRPTAAPPAAAAKPAKGKAAKAAPAPAPVAAAPTPAPVAVAKPAKGKAAPEPVAAPAPAAVAAPLPAAPKTKGAARPANKKPAAQPARPVAAAKPAVVAAPAAAPAAAPVAKAAPAPKPAAAVKKVVKAKVRAAAAPARTRPSKPAAKKAKKGR